MSLNSAALAAHENLLRVATNPRYRILQEVNNELGQYNDYWPRTCLRLNSSGATPLDSEVSPIAGCRRKAVRFRRSGTMHRNRTARRAAASGGHLCLDVGHPASPWAKTLHSRWIADGTGHAIRVFTTSCLPSQRHTKTLRDARRSATGNPHNVPQGSRACGSKTVAEKCSGFLIIKSVPAGVLPTTRLEQKLNRGINDLPMNPKEE